MKKMVKAIAAVPVLVGLAAVPAIAADQLDMSGEMRVRAWMMDYDGKDDKSFLDHRLRMYGKFKVNENVQVHFRTDLTEEEWGSTDSTFGAGRMPGTSMQVDRGFLQLANDSMRLRAGLQYYELMPSAVICSQDEGFLFTLKNDVAPVHFAAVMDGDDMFDNEIADENWWFAVATSPKFGAVSVDVAAAYFMGTQDAVTDATTGVVTSPEQDTNIYVLAGAISVDAGMARIFGEIDLFGGEINDTTDATGLQGYVGADLKVSDAVTITPAFWYAQAASAGEQQVVVFGNDFGGWDPAFDVGTKLDNEKIGLGRPFDWTGGGAGVIGATLISKFKVSDAVSLGAGINYLTVEDDAVVDDTLLGLVGGVSYKFMGNARIDAQIEYHDHDADGADAIMGGIYLGVGF